MKIRLLALLVLLMLSVSALSAKPPLLLYCWNLDNTSCTTVGATQGCTDGIWFDYVCTCRSWVPGPGQQPVRYWDCPEVR